MNAGWPYREIVTKLKQFIARLLVPEKDNRLTRSQARLLMRNGVAPGYACASCPRENFWLCTVQETQLSPSSLRVVCHPDEVIPAFKCKHEHAIHHGPYR